MKLYILRKGQILGPFTGEEVRRQLAAGTISNEDLYAAEGDAGWKPMAQGPFAPPVTPAPAPVPPPLPVSSTPLPVTSGLPMGSTASHAGYKSTSNLAVASMICGALSLFCCVIGAIPAVILGHLALTDIRRNPGLQGREMALTGLIFGYVILGLSLFGTATWFILAALGAHVNSSFSTFQTH